MLGHGGPEKPRPCLEEGVHYATPKRPAFGGIFILTVQQQVLSSASMPSLLGNGI